MTESNDFPEVPDTVAELLGETGFDPRNLPGAEVMFDDGDVSVVAVPISSIPDGPPADNAVTLGSLLGALDTPDLFDQGSRVAVQLDHMTWATEENLAACERHGETVPEDKDSEGGPIFESHRLAACLYQPYMAPERIFRAHAREIYERVATGQDLRPGTDAEILGVLCDWLTDVPFCAGLMALYFRLAQKIVQDDYAKLLKNYQEANPEFDLAAFLAEAKDDADEHERDLREQLTRDRHPEADL